MVPAEAACRHWLGRGEVVRARREHDVSMFTPPSATERPRLLAIQAARLFDGVGTEVIADPLVVLDGATIVSVQHGVKPPDGAEVVDLGGATLMPGLIDTHVHLVFDSGVDPVGMLAARTDDQALAAARDAALVALRGGVTTVRDLGDRNYLSLGLRDEPGLPTILSAGPPITTPGGHCHFLGGATDATEEGVRAAVREHVERGVDVIKIMASGGTMTPGTRQEVAQFPAGVLRAAVQEAHLLGLVVTAHAHGTQAIRDAVDAGVDGMEHVSFWSAEGVDEPGDLIELIAERGITVGATVGIRPVPGDAPPPAVVSRLPLILENTRRLVEAGARIVAGTDAGIGQGKPHDVCRFAMPQLRDLGMDAAQALRAVTSVAAHVCGLSDRKGRVAAGFDADLLAVDGDPLTDPEAVHRISAVYHNGRAVTLSSPAVR